MEKIENKNQFIDKINFILHPYDLLYDATINHTTMGLEEEDAEVARDILYQMASNKDEMKVTDLQEFKCGTIASYKLLEIIHILTNYGLIKKSVRGRGRNRICYYSFESNNIDNENDDFEKLLKFIENFYLDDSNCIVTEANNKYEKEDQFLSFEKKIDKEKLLEYLNALVNLNSDIHSLKQRYDYLREEMLEKTIQNVSNFKKMNEKLIKEKKNILVEIEKLNNITKPTYINEISLPIPQKKNKPILKVNKPEEPKYLIPNFFNKKKVEMENEKLKKEYDKNLNLYNIEYGKYISELKEYDEYLINYEKEIEEIKSKEKILNDENYNKKLQEYENKKEENETLLNNKKLELKNFENDYFSKMDKNLLENEEYQDIKKAKYELEYINSLLQQDIELENNLYSYGIIYGKYRNFVAITSFYDYLISGRCSELEGNDGAYNLFEEETRNNIIIEKLDQVIVSIDKIKSMQYSLYNQINNINKSLNLINGQLLVNNFAQAEIVANTNVTAYYSKKISNYTKALNILTFLK